MSHDHLITCCKCSMPVRDIRDCDCNTPVPSYNIYKCPDCKEEDDYQRAENARNRDY